MFRESAVHEASVFRTLFENSGFTVCKDHEECATPGQIEESRIILDTLAAERGRDPASLSISVFGQPTDTSRDQIDAFLNAGADRVAVWPAYCDTEAEMGEQLERMAESMIR